MGLSWAAENFHNHTKGKAANWDAAVEFETVRGWRLDAVEISSGRRFILYLPSGAWWHLDVQITPKRVAETPQ